MFSLGGTIRNVGVIFHFSCVVIFQQGAIRTHPKSSGVSSSLYWRGFFRCHFSDHLSRMYSLKFRFLFKNGSTFFSSIFFKKKSTFLLGNFSFFDSKNCTFFSSVFFKKNSTFLLGNFSFFDSKNWSTFFSSVFSKKILLFYWEIFHFLILKIALFSLPFFLKEKFFLSTWKFKFRFISKNWGTFLFSEFLKEKFHFFTRNFFIFSFLNFFSYNFAWSFLVIA